MPGQVPHVIALRLAGGLAAAPNPFDLLTEDRRVFIRKKVVSLAVGARPNGFSEEPALWINMAAIAPLKSTRNQAPTPPAREAPKTPKEPARKLKRTRKHR